MSASSRSPYFTNAVGDWLLMGGGSIGLYFVMLGLRSPTLAPSTTTLSLVLLWLVNWPHFSASFQRIYRTEAAREKYRFTVWVLPLITLIALLSALTFPEQVAPYLVKTYMLWAPFHFSGQTFGLCLVYARRTGVEVGLWQKRILRGFVFGTFLLMVAREESMAWVAPALGIEVFGLGIPTWVAPFFEAAVYAFVVALLWWVVQWSRLERKVFPTIVLMPAIAQYLWFVEGPRFLAYYTLVPFFHSLQYLPVVAAVYLKERAGEEGHALSKKECGQQLVRWLRANFIGGAFLFFGIPLALSLFRFPLDFSRGVVFALINLHHFIVDGVVWKLRDPQVRRELSLA